MLYDSGAWSLQALHKTKESMFNIYCTLNDTTQVSCVRCTKIVADALDEFASLYDTPGNYMLLPMRKMRSERNRCTQNRIDMTIYESFRGGELAHFFVDREHLIDWIYDQNLQVLFEEGRVEQECLNWLTVGDHMITQLGTGELIQYVDNLVDIIKQRNCLIKDGFC